jgi:hypothetical protein
MTGGSKSRNNCVTETGLAEAGGAETGGTAGATKTGATETGATETGVTETGLGERSFNATSDVGALLSGVGGPGGIGISWVSRACAL